MIRLEFPIRALAKQSFKISKNGNYQPADVVNFKNAIKLLALSQLPKNHTLLDGCIFVSVDYVFAAPQSTSSARMTLVRDKDCIVWMNVVPDLDNVTKALYDALNKTVWVDDKRVVSEYHGKRYGVEDAIIVCVRAEPHGFVTHKSIPQSSKWLLDAEDYENTIAEIENNAEYGLTNKLLFSLAVKSEYIESLETELTRIKSLTLDEFALMQHEAKFGGNA